MTSCTEQTRNVQTIASAKRTVFLITCLSSVYATYNRELKYASLEMYQSPREITRAKGVSIMQRGAAI
jgi:hypothetical protein